MDSILFDPSFRAVLTVARLNLSDHFAGGQIGEGWSHKAENILFERPRSRWMN